MHQFRMISRAALLLCGVAGILVVAGGAKPDGNLQPKLKALRDVAAEGKGHRAATQAWAELTVEARAEQLPEILAALDGASPLAANWIRAAFDAVAERQLEQGSTLPLADLEKFLGQRDHDQRARRLAYEWIARVDSAAPDRLIPQMLDDPSLEMRREAVARVILSAEKAAADKKTEAALAAYQQALVAARDVDQVLATAEALKKLGHPVDLARHFGFLMDWKLVGPFDNRGGMGFAVAYPPEENLDLTAKYPGAEGEVRWVAHHTDNEFGFVDVNQALGKHKGAASYAVAEFQSDRAGPAEIRLGTENANKIWLNGKLLASTDVYHNNIAMDQYVGRGELRSGRNVILLKICQNEQTEDWAQDWKFQCRVCDASGKAILSIDRPATITAKPATANASQPAAKTTQE